MTELFEIQRICSLLDREQIGRAEFLPMFARQMAVEIGCSRAGIRILLDDAHARVLRCATMYELSSERPLVVPDLHSDYSRRYFDTLLRVGAVMVDDARKHPLTAPFRETYLDPMDVYSMLDVNLSVNGLTFGTFSCEQTRSPVDWSPRQLNLLRRIASRASLSLIQAVTATMDTTPGSLWDASSLGRLTSISMPLDGGEDTSS